MAQRGINKVIVLGHLGDNPQTRYTNSGQAVVTLSIATSDSWTDKNSGELREKTEWHRVVLFGRVAEVASEYLRKGSQVYIEGQLQTRKWQDQTGVDRYSTEIVVQGYSGTLQLLGSRSDSSKTDPHTPWEQPNQSATFNQKTPVSSGTTNQPNITTNPTPHSQDDPPLEFDDDIPF